jgi:hypothetical protein
MTRIEKDSSGKAESFAQIQKETIALEALLDVWKPSKLIAPTTVAGRAQRLAKAD